MATSEKKFRVLNEKDEIVKEYVKKQSAVDYASKYNNYYVIRIKDNEIVFKNEVKPVSDEPITNVEEQVEIELDKIEENEVVELENEEKDIVEPILEEQPIVKEEEILEDNKTDFESIEKEEVERLKEMDQAFIDLTKPKVTVKVYRKKSLLRRIIDRLFKR